MNSSKNNSYVQAFIHDTAEFVKVLLLSGKIRLADIPLYVRSNGVAIYITALRVSREFYKSERENR